MNKADYEPSFLLPISQHSPKPCSFNQDTSDMKNAFLSISSSGRQFLQLSLIALFATPALATPPPNDLIGIWSVTQVAVDESDTPHALYKPNDLTLKYRILSIQHDQAALNDGLDPCTKLNVTADRATTLSLWIGRTFPRPTNSGESVAPSLDDFELSEPNQTITPLKFHCDAAGDSKERLSIARFILLNDGSLLVSYDPAVLVLKRLTDAKPMTPGFNCAKAATPTEHAICKSPGLSGYDRSISEAYKELIKLHPDDAEAAKQQQTAWLKKRDECGDKEACLEDTMQDRVSEVVQELN